MIVCRDMMFFNIVFQKQGKPVILVMDDLLTCSITELLTFEILVMELPLLLPITEK